jgi:hypothetical protein
MPSHLRVGINGPLLQYVFKLKKAALRGLSVNDAFY